MQNCCSLNEREYEIVYFSDFEKSFEELKLASKIKNKILIHLGNKEISPKFLSYMLDYHQILHSLLVTSI